MFTILKSLKDLTWNVKVIKLHAFFYFNSNLVNIIFGESFLYTTKTVRKKTSKKPQGFFELWTRSVMFLKAVHPIWKFQQAKAQNLISPNMCVRYGIWTIVQILYESLHRTVGKYVYRLQLSESCSVNKFDRLSQQICKLEWFWKIASPEQ